MYTALLGPWRRIPRSDRAKKSISGRLRASRGRLTAVIGYEVVIRQKGCH